jgi:hypothetical protein
MPPFSRKLIVLMAWGIRTEFRRGNLLENPYLEDRQEMDNIMIDFREKGFEDSR